MKKINFSFRKIVAITSLLLIILFTWIYVIGISGREPGSFFNKGHNAIWLGHEWVDEKKKNQEIVELVSKLSENEIDTVFVHTGPINPDGGIDKKTYKYALYFIQTVKKINPDIKYQAWLGQIRSKIDLSDGKIRRNIAKNALILTELIGFDGIHMDIEPVWDEDNEFIALLQEIRTTIPEDRIMSVALAEFIPGSIIWLTDKIQRFENFNTEKNYTNVAKYADQIVVMAYDTGIKQDWLYRWLVEEQTIWLSNLLAGTELFVGIPSYDEVTDAFDPEVENVQNGLEGIIGGLNNIRSEEENFAGVAIYPYWEMDETEWLIYKGLWLK